MIARGGGSIQAPPKEPTSIYPVRGLSQQEVVLRRARGDGNSAPAATSRTYAQILRENLFTFINICLFCLGAALAALGRPLDAITSSGLILVNIAVSVFQEVRAKRTLDRIALLTRPGCTVIRDGKAQEVRPEDVVIGDVLKLGPGDQVVVDGRVIGDDRFAVDESQLTGESDHIPKGLGDPVYSGSFCVTGSGFYTVERVGERSLANQITAGARTFRRILTPLQRDLYTTIRIALLIVVYMEFLLFVNSLLKEISLQESVQNSAVVAALVPNGLFLSIAVAYALGAVRIVRYGALVQQANAIESLSNVDVLCFDKTGTLTTNKLVVSGVHALSVSSAELQRILGCMAASTASGNKTSQAIASAFSETPIHPTKEVPFSSERKWSAMVLDDQGRGVRGTFALGAPEMLEPYLSARNVSIQQVDNEVQRLASQGLRVLLVAQSADSEGLRQEGERWDLPEEMEPLGLVSLADELRPDARETLAAFVAAGVTPKIISGDNGETVAALARQAGLGPDIHLVSGLELEGMDEDAFRAAATANTVFGRITPKQKEHLIRAWRQSGHYMAMIGDGVNDVLSLKQADLGIAMQSGSQAARGVADIVLLQDSFGVLVPAVREGQRIINGMHSILRLFLTRIATVGLVVMSALVVGYFPLEVRQGSIVTFLSVGIPSVMLAVWAQPGPTGRRRLGSILHFVLTPTIITGVMGLLLFYGVLLLLTHQQGGFSFTVARHLVLHRNLQNLALARTTLASFLTVTGVLLLIFVQPPTSWLTGGSRQTTDWRPTFLALGLVAAFVVISQVGPLRSLFALRLLDYSQLLILLCAVPLWGLCVRFAWRWHLLERFLGIGPGSDRTV